MSEGAPVVATPGHDHHDYRGRITVATRFPADRPGGVERVADEIVNGLRRAQPNWDVRQVFAYLGPSRIEGLPVLGDLFASLKLAIRTAYASDVVVINGAEYSWAPLVVARALRRPVVVVWHGIRGSQVEAMLEGDRRLSRGLAKRVKKRLFIPVSDILSRIGLLANVTVAVSPQVEEDIRRRFGFRGSVRVIPNGVDFQGTELPHGSPILPSWQESPPEASEVRAIWVGTSPYVKGLDIAIDACVESRRRGLPVTLTVVGIKEEQVSDTLYEASEWLRWRGPVSPSDIGLLLSQHDVLLFPSRYEGCSMVVLEALAAGLPVIGSEAVGWQIGQAGVVVMGQNVALYAGALASMANVAYRRELGVLARKRIEDFSLELMVGQYASVISDLCLRNSRTLH